MSKTTIIDSLRNSRRPLVLRLDGAARKHFHQFIKSEENKKLTTSANEVKLGVKSSPLIMIKAPMFPIVSLKNQQKIFEQTEKKEEILTNNWVLKKLLYIFLHE